MATDGSGAPYVAVSSAALQTYNVNAHPHHTFIVVGNTPEPSSAPNIPDHFEGGYKQSCETAGITAASSGNEPATTKSNMPADRSLERNPGNVSPDLSKVESRKRACNRAAPHKLECSECGLVCNSSSDLAGHLSTQHCNHITSYRCLYCTQIFFSKQPLLDHIKSVLLDKQPSPTHVAGMISCVKHTCPDCLHVHVSAQNLKVHLLKSRCGEASSAQASSVHVKKTKLRCMKAVLQSYKPEVVSLNTKSVSSDSRTTNTPPCETDTNHPHSTQVLQEPPHHLKRVTPSHSDKRRVTPPSQTLSQMGPCKLPLPSYFYPPPAPTAPLRAPLVPPTQYYSLDYYQYPASNLTPAHPLPHQYSYQPRVSCDNSRVSCDNSRGSCDTSLLDKQLFSCLHCGSKFPEFDMLARHFRENTCNSAAQASLEGIVSCCSETPY